MPRPAEVAVRAAAARPNSLAPLRREGQASRLVTRVRPAAATTFIVLTAGVRAGMATATVATSLFLVLDVGADPLQLVLVGTVLEATVLVCEVPTGVVADVAGRRRSVVAGVAVMGAGFLLYAVPSFAVVVAAQVVWGFGWTLVSGADVAWVTDAVGEERARPLYLRAAQAGHVATVGGLAAGVAVAVVAGRPAAIATGGVVLLALAAWLAAAMAEDGPAPSPGRPAAAPRSARATAGVTARAALRTARSRRSLQAALAVVAVGGAAGEGVDRLRDLHLLTGPGLPAGADPVVWVGLLGTASLLVAVAVTARLRRRPGVVATPRAAARAVGAANLAVAAAVVGFAVAPSFPVAAACLLAAAAARQVASPLVTAWVNHDLDPASRATVNSMAGQADALGQVVGGPGLGALAAARSVRLALVAAGLAHLPAAALLARRPDRQPSRRTGVDDPTA